MIVHWIYFMFHKNLSRNCGAYHCKVLNKSKAYKFSRTVNHKMLIKLTMLTKNWIEGTLLCDQRKRKKRKCSWNELLSLKIFIEQLQKAQIGLKKDFTVFFLRLKLSWHASRFQEQNKWTSWLTDWNSMKVSMKWVLMFSSTQASHSSHHRSQVSFTNASQNHTSAQTQWIFSEPS